MEQVLFQEACDRIIDKDREKRMIGTLGEKTVHAVLKHYLEPDESYHEIKVEGYFADIARQDEIIEIQTRNFNKLTRKLGVFLKRGYVTVVHPIPYVRWMCWINEETGEVSKPRKSPRLGNYQEVFRELFWIKDFLCHPNLRIHLILMNMEESRLLNGWSKDKKKGSTRFDRIPVEIVDEIFLDGPMDYRYLVPDSLAEGFSVKDYQKASRLNNHWAGTALNILYFVGAVERVGKKGNAFLYKVAEEEKT